MPTQANRPMSTPNLRRMLRALPLLVVGAYCPFAAAQLGITQPPLPAPTLPTFVPKADDSRFVLPPIDEKMALPSPSTATLHIERIRYSGNRRFSAEQLDAVAAPYLGRPLNAADLEELRLRLTRHYVDAGFINSGVLLRPGALADGTLNVDVIEGEISFVRLRGLERLDEDYVVGRLLPDQSAALNINELRERFQLLLADPLLTSAQARLIPDSQPGRAILDIDIVRARPYQLTTYVNNYRTASVGERTLGLTGWLRNVTGWGDYAEIALQQGEAPYNGNRRQTLLWSLPLGSAGTELGLFSDHAEATVVEPPAKSLNIQSEQHTSEIRLSQRLLENLRHKLSVGLTYNQRSNSSFLLGTPFSFAPGEMDGITRSYGWRFWQEYAQRGEAQALVLRSTFSRNRNNLHAMAGAPADENTLWLGQAHLARRLTDGGLQLSLRASIQLTDQHLPAMDQFGIGGNQTVRGFRENLLLRDRGQIINLDLAYPVWSSPAEKAALSLGVFHDVGSGRNRGERSFSLNASGLTAKASYGQLHADLAYALRRHRPAALGEAADSWQDRGLHLQIAYQFFD